MRLASAANWWLRSPYCNSNNGAPNALNVNTNGNWSNNNCSNGGYAIRPALMGNEMSRQEYLPKTVYHLSKGVASLSKACAWADDEYIIPRQAAPARGRSLLPWGSGPVLGEGLAGASPTNPASGSKGEILDLRRDVRF